jgi:hypothetical protein
MKKIFFKAFIVSFSFFITLSFFLIVSYFLFPLTYLKPSLKYILTSSSDEIFISKKEFINFFPNSFFKIDSVSLQSDEPNKIFSYNFTSNNYGFIQNNDLNKYAKSTVFIGDSFTQGFGYKSWVEDIKLNTAQDTQIINAGIMSTGFIDWYYHLRLINNYFFVKNTYILFISDDMYRKQFLPTNQALNCIKLSIGCNTFSSFVGVDYDFNKKNSFINYLYVLYRNLAFNLFIKKSRFQNNIGALHRIIDENSINNLVFFHIPMIGEVLSNSYDINTSQIVDIIESSGLTYVSLLNRCYFTVDDYYQIDHHMNASGYEKLKKCIENYLNQVNTRM